MLLKMWDSCGSQSPEAGPIVVAIAWGYDGAREHSGKKPADGADRLYAGASTSIRTVSAAPSASASTKDRSRSAAA